MSVSERRPYIGHVLIVCKKCGGRCRSASSKKLVTYYYCEDCGQGTKVMRPPLPNNGK